MSNKNLKKSDVNIEFTKEQIEEYVKCSKDPLYFINNYVMIINVDDGLVPFNTRPYQDRMLDAFFKERFVLCKLPRQSGKSTIVTAFMLWCVLFREHQVIALLANKESLAIKQLDRIKLAYEHLPKWLQQGVVEWSKKTIELENGSTIEAHPTSSSSIRGGSYNLIFLDEFAHVETNLAEDFFASTYPTISSGKTTQVIIVSTPKGMNHFYKMWVNAEEKRNSYVALEVHWTEVPNYDEEWKAETIANIGEESFDQEYECSFLGSNHTLITSSKLRNIAWRVPKYSKNGLDIFHDPAIGHEYVTVVDTSEGVGLDYSAFTVIDVTEVPYRVVAKYRKNDISSLMYPEVVYNVATKYNHSFVLVETNSIGQQVADILHHDLEYEHVIMTAKRGRAGQQIGDFGGKSTPGIKTSVQVKKIGCANLKTLIESEKLIIEDFDIVFELSNFVRKKQSYSADDGHNDDLVMTLVLFGWLARQDYFKEMTNTDFRKRMLDENKQAIEEDMLPFGLLDDGRDETIPNEEVVEFGDDFGGNFWQESDNDYW